MRLDIPQLDNITRSLDVEVRDARIATRQSAAQLGDALVTAAFLVFVGLMAVAWAIGEKGGPRDH